MTKQERFKQAWEEAKEAAEKFGGDIHEFFVGALTMLYRRVEEIDVENAELRVENEALKKEAREAQARADANQSALVEAQAEKARAERRACDAEAEAEALAERVREMEGQIEELKSAQPVEEPAEEKEEEKFFEFDIDEKGDARKPVYVAKITGLDPQFGLAREFDLPGINTTKGGGMKCVFGTLKAIAGEVFEIATGQGSWKNPEKDFYRVSEAGNLDHFASATTATGKAKVAKLFQK